MDRYVSRFWHDMVKFGLDWVGWVSEMKWMMIVDSIVDRACERMRFRRRVEEDGGVYQFWIDGWMGTWIG